MKPTEAFPGFSPAVDPQEQVDHAMALLGRRPDLQGRLRITPDPVRKRRAGGWSVFGFRGSAGEFNESPHPPAARSGQCHMREGDSAEQGAGRVVDQAAIREAGSPDVPGVAGDGARDGELPGHGASLDSQATALAHAQRPEFPGCLPGLRSTNPPRTPGLGGEETARVGGSGPARRRQ